MNPGLPLTDNQKARQLQLKENEKKAATARAAASPLCGRDRQPSDSRSGSSGAASPIVARLSSPLSPWAPPCTFWQKGECKRGVKCHFHHAGFPVEERRCFTCKSTEHSSKDCPCPGGGADAEKDKHWEEYRARRKAAEEAGKIGKGSKGGSKGGTKGGKKGRQRQPERRRQDGWAVGRATFR